MSKARSEELRLTALECRGEGLEKEWKDLQAKRSIIDKRNKPRSVV
jgi:hypothetical protein